MNRHFACFHFDAHQHRATLIHPLTRKELLFLPAQECRSSAQGLCRHPASAFSAQLANYIGWLVRHHLLFQPAPLEIAACIDDASDLQQEVEENTGHAVQLETLAFTIPDPPEDVWLDAGRAGFILLDGMLYSSFYLDVEELHT